MNEINDNNNDSDYNNVIVISPEFSDYSLLDESNTSESEKISYIDIDDELSFQKEERKKLYWQKLESLQIKPFLHEFGNSSFVSINNQNVEKLPSSGKFLITEEENQLLEENLKLIDLYFNEDDDYSDTVSNSSSFYSYGYSVEFHSETNNNNNYNDSQTEESLRNAISWLIDCEPPLSGKNEQNKYEESEVIINKLMKPDNNTNPWWFLEKLPINDSRFYYETISKELNGKEKTITYLIVNHELTGKKWDITFEFMNPTNLISFKNYSFEVSVVTHHYLKLSSLNYGSIIHKNVLKLLNNNKHDKMLNSFGNSNDLLNHLFEQLPLTAIPRIDGCFNGVLIFQKINSSAPIKIDKIRLGDILLYDQRFSKENFEFQSDHSYKESISSNFSNFRKKIHLSWKGGQNEKFTSDLFLGIVTKSNLIKKEIKAVQFVKDEGLVSTMFNLDLLEHGILKVFRPVGKEILPWNNN